MSQPAIQHPLATHSLSRIHLQTTEESGASVSQPLRNLGPTLQIHVQTTAAKEGSVNRLLSTLELHSITIGFTYILQQRRRSVLAGHSAPWNDTPSRSDSLTYYSSEGGQC